MLTSSIYAQHISKVYTECNMFQKYKLNVIHPVPVYDAKGNVVAASKIPEDLPPLPVSLDIPRGKSGRCSIAWKNLKTAIEDSEPENNSGAQSEQGSDEEDSQPTEERTPADDKRHEEVIPNSGLQGLGFEAMLRSVLPSKNVKRAGSRETELWHTAMADA